MSIQAILLPLFVQIFLTIAVMAYMSRVRREALGAGQVKIPEIALAEKIWPAKAQQVSNNFHNLLELPPLFYVAVIIAILTKKADLLFVILSWVFVLGRVAHSFVHCTSNNVRMRSSIFMVSAIALIVIWIVLFVRIMFSL